MRSGQVLCSSMWTREVLPDHPDWRQVSAAYFGAVTFGIAQPVYSFTRGAPAAQTLGLFDWVAVVLAVNVGCTVAFLLARLLVRPLRTTLDLLVYSGMAVFFFRQVQLEYFPTGGLLHPSAEAFVFVTVPLVTVSCVYLLRRYVTVYLANLGMLSLFFPIHFMLSHESYSLESQLPSPVLAAARSVPDVRHSNLTVFMFVFDEVSLDALLDDTGNIDQAAFPNFDRFSRTSLWFRQAIANHAYTRQSVANLLTGSPDAENLLDLRSLPRANLLAQLAGAGYRVTVYSRVFRCVPMNFECLDYYRIGGIGTIRKLMTGTASVYLPPRLLNRYAAAWAAQGKLEEGRLLVALAHSELARPGSASLIHLLVSHAPYALSSDGTAIGTDDFEFRAHARPEPTLRRYRQQLQYLDRQFGSFLDGLKNAGALDRSVIVVTSDHGACWTARCMGRLNVEVVEPTLARVPMMIHAPSLPPRVVDYDYQHIDFLPTVLDVVGAPPPAMDVGRSALSPPPQERSRRFYIGGRCVEFGLPARSMSVDRPCKLEQAVDAPSASDTRSSDAS